ncbi:cell division protein FtsQ/DivIB [Vibrio breoganii]|uniref:Cell division protein FtsQ n=2 Tax=Vibrio TaxID=662 RepID=A0AAP8MZH7_9VIBR|nr:cell division protein FtsQ/DivIB [Vibrio breoganii]NMO72552.1 FtsQ-type POTRA domain-containing protein [Vibrio breoganii]NMR69214.1 FtsQ-type POTRA domain-containing protein [Vibrio breoganii]OCH73931.1 cell division protein FtsQ [Vibrio breoganii]OEF86316.1 cell division protein FtsQ [Vibrio breoganii 1C10]PMF91602.1 cell division protein FtsQ [Vibrio breoganii]
MESTLDVETEYKQRPRFKFSWVDASFLLFVVALIVFGIFSTVAWMRDSGRLPLSQFVLEGDIEYVHSTDVQSVLSHIHPFGTFMTQDVNQLQTAVESLPWVASAAIRKQWPNTIKVFLMEHHPAAIWNGNALLNSNGQIFYADVGQLHQQDQEIVKLYGPETESERVLDTWREIEPQFASLGLQITSVVLNDRHAWQLILDNGIRLELGKDALEERIQRFVDLYHHMDERVQQISYIDLRYDTGAAIGWLTEDQRQESSNDQGHG